MNKIQREKLHQVWAILAHAHTHSFFSFSFFFSNPVVSVGRQWASVVLEGRKPSRLLMENDILNVSVSLLALGRCPNRAPGASERKVIWYKLIRWQANEAVPGSLQRKGQMLRIAGERKVMGSSSKPESRAKTLSGCSFCARVSSFYSDVRFPGWTRSQEKKRVER